MQSAVYLFIQLSDTLSFYPSFTHHKTIHQLIQFTIYSPINPAIHLILSSIHPPISFKQKNKLIFCKKNVQKSTDFPSDCQRDVCTHSPILLCISEQVHGFCAALVRHIRGGAADSAAHWLTPPSLYSGVWRLGENQMLIANHCGGLLAGVLLQWPLLFYHQSLLSFFISHSLAKDLT